MAFQDAGTWIFDFDGTLYAEQRPFELYAEELAKRLPENLRDAFWRDYQNSMQGRHPLRPGRGFARPEHIVRYRYPEGATQWLDWQGNPQPAREGSVQWIGDLWWIGPAIAAHYGLTPEAQDEAFLAVRELMADPAFPINGHPGLRQLLEQAHERHRLVLLTNSPEPDSKAILRKLNLLDAFDHIGYRSNKPKGLATYLDQLSGPLDDLLSVGDNFFNDVAPAIERGAQAIYIDPYGEIEVPTSVQRVASPSELLAALQRRL